VRLAATATLSEMTISEFENGIPVPKPFNVAAMRRALEGAGIVFTEGSVFLAHPEGPKNSSHADNRNWRRRQTKHSPAR